MGAVGTKRPVTSQGHSKSSPLGHDGRANLFCCIEIEEGKTLIIKLNAIGRILWGKISDYIDRLVRARGISRDEAYAEIASRIPLGRIPEGSEVAGAVVFMASGLAAAVTGQTLDVNGGQVMY